MRVNQYSIIIVLALLVLSGQVCGQASFLVEARYGTFTPEISNFNKIYDNDEYLPALAVGLGSDQGFVIARYYLYEEWGESIVDGVDLVGKASWRQEFITIGVRSYEQGRMYFELAYAMGKAEETITTVPPDYSALNSSWAESDIKGGAAALGINIPFGLGLHFNGEVGYLYLPVNDADDNKVNLGGRQISLGLTWAL